MFYVASSICLTCLAKENGTLREENQYKIKLEYLKTQINAFFSLIP
jgi:hypothetical protein